MEVSKGRGLTKAHLGENRKKVLIEESQDSSIFLLWGEGRAVCLVYTEEKRMPNISGALESYRCLLKYRYKFSISSNKKRYDINLTFKKSDFFHLVGFQYLSDIDIPKSHVQLFSKIDNGKINDIILAKSIYYCKVDESYANVKERIEGMRCLKEYIESDNMVFKYIKNRNMYSSIRADFMIKSTVNRKMAFFFLRKRTNEEAYCICSFFVNPQNEYYGARAYWLYKSRISLENGEETVLYDRLGC